MNIKLKYTIGESIKTLGLIYKVIGFEYVKDRGIRYILLHMDGGKGNWEYLYDFEIKMIQKK